MLELIVILVFAVMFLGPCAIATGIVRKEDEEMEEVASSL